MSQAIKYIQCIVSTSDSEPLVCLIGDIGGSTTHLFIPAPCWGIAEYSNPGLAVLIYRRLAPNPARMVPLQELKKRI